MEILTLQSVLTGSARNGQCCQAQDGGSENDVESHRCVMQCDGGGAVKLNR